MPKVFTECADHVGYIEMPLGKMGCVDCGKAFWYYICVPCNRAFVDPEEKGSDDYQSAAYFHDDGSVLCEGCNDGPDDTEPEKGDTPGMDDGFNTIIKASVVGGFIGGFFDGGPS